MNCDAYKEKLPLFAFDELDEMQRADVERHVASCPDCAAELAEFSALVAEFSGSGSEGLSELEKLKIENEVLKASLNIQSDTSSHPFAGSGFICIAAAIVLIFVGFSAGAYFPKLLPSKPATPSSAGRQVQSLAIDQISPSNRFTASGIKLLVRGATNLSGKTTRR